MQIGSVQSGSMTLLTQPAKAAKVASFASYAPADTNQDGVVSAAEALAYDLKHPEKALLKAAQASTRHAQVGTGNTSAQYTQKGTLRAAHAPNGFLDLSA